jgi:hypothetical protein
MSNYTKTTNFASKDNLSPGNPLKIVKGTEIDTEFNNIQTAVATKTDNSAANITGGSITGITDLAVADGGTGASTATAALNNLLPTQTGNANKYLQTDGTNATWDAVTLSTADITGTLPVANGGTGVTASTGTGSVVLSNSPTLVTPALGTPASGTATNLTGLPISTGVSGLGTGVATFLGTPSSANLASAVTDETGSGALVFANSPTLVTPALGTPSALVGTNITGTASGLTAGNVTTNANLTGAVTSVGNATSLGSFTSANLLGALTDETGTGSAVFATSPTLVTPILGTPTSATLTNATGLPIATGVSGLGTGVATALAVNVGSSGAPLVNGGVLGTPSSGTVTNLTGTASININGTVGATTASTGAFTTTTISTSETLSYGTANAVTYLNASKVLTSGTGLQYDGTVLKVNGSTTSALRLTSNSAVSSGFNLYNDSVNDIAYLMNGYNGSMVFGINNAEQMRLTSTGLGIGTSSPAAKLDVKAADASNAIRLTATTGTNGSYQTFTNTGNTFYVGVDSSTGAALGFGAYAAGMYSTTKIVLQSGSASNSLILDTSGNLLVGTTSAVSGGGVLQVSNGITFPATQSASSNANTLDDYEEGTWTPVDDSGAGLSFTTSDAFYTKIGNVVYVSCAVTFPTTASVLAIRIGGLPFTVKAGSNNVSAASIAQTNSSRTDAFCYVRSTTQIAANTNGNADANNISYSAKFICLSGFYFV